MRLSGLQRKLFLVTRPESYPKRNWMDYVRFLLKILARPRFQITSAKWPKPVVWKNVVGAMAKAGYRLPSKEPVPGTVLAFDGAYRAVELCRGARTSLDYIAAIESGIGATAQARAQGRT